MSAKEFRIPARLTGGHFQDNEHGGICFPVGLDFGGSGIGSFTGGCVALDLIKGILALAGTKDSRRIEGKQVWVYYTPRDGEDPNDPLGPWRAEHITRIAPLMPDEGTPLDLGKWREK
jgi:hypothetical protein